MLCLDRGLVKPDSTQAGDISTGVVFMPDIEIGSLRDPLRQRMGVEFIEHLAPLGSRMVLETNSREVLDACRTSFGRYGNCAYPTDEPLIKVRLLVDPDFGETAPWPDPVFRCQRSTFYVSVGRQNTAVASLDDGTVVGFISPAMAREPTLLRKTFLDGPVLTLLTHGSRGRYAYLHASAVAFEGKGLLFAGPNESGKSTLAYACARSGFDFVSDDVVYLRQTEGGLAAWGRPWHLRLLLPALRLFPELSHLDRKSESAEEVIEIEMEGILPGRCRTRCEPAALVFLMRSEGAPSFRPLEADEAMERLSSDLMYDVPEALERHRRHWLELSRRGTYLLRCGTDLDSLTSLVRTFVGARRGAASPA